MRSSLLIVSLLAAALALSACKGGPPADVGSPTLVDAPLAETTVGAGYSATIGANGGKAPYTFSAQGLPPGISLASDSGRLTGTPSTAGDFQVQVTLKDASGKQDSKAFAIKVYPGVYFKQTALPQATAESPYSALLEFEGGKAPLALKLGAGDLPPGVQLNGSTRRLEGTFPSAGTVALTVEATDVHGSKATQPYTITVSEPLRLTASLPPGNVGLPYAQGIVSSGGRAPLTLSISNGVLPPGLEINGGLISGTPTIAGRFSFTVKLTDANGATASAPVILDIVSHLPPQLPAATLSNGFAGRAYTHLLLGAEGAPPYTFALTSGSLPAGLSLSPAGVIFGTPTTVETQSFQVTLTDSQGQRAQRTFTLSIHPLLVVETASLAEGYQGQFYNQTLTASGGRLPYRWEVQGTLPAGLTLTPAGFLSGTPTVAGSYGLVFTLTDASGQLATGALQLTLYALPAITNTALADGAVGAPYNQRLRASGGKSPHTFAITGGVLPPGLVLTGDTINGTPTGAVTSNLTFQVRDANGRSSTRDLDVRIFNGLTITTGTLDDSYVGRSYVTTLTAVGGDTSRPYSWTSIGALPAGLSLSPSGVISGTATTAGTTRFTAQVTDNSGGSTTRVFDLRVLALPSVTTTSLPGAYVDGAYSTTLAGTGGLPPYQWRLSGGTLPAGMTLSSGGVLSGTPTTPGTSSFTVELTDSNNVSTTANLSLTASVLAITSASMAEGYTGEPYTYTLAASGGPTPFTWNVAGLPSGLSYDASTGVVSGTPVASGTTSISVRVTDALNRVATRGLSLIVYGPPQITTSALAAGFTQVAYNQPLEAINGKPPHTWSITSGTLHAGLAFNASTGTWAISGTPTEPGTRSLTFRVSDANGRTASRTLELAIYAPLVLTTTPLPDAYAGRPYDQTLTASGGRPAYAFDRSGGALPGGLSLSTAGRISGTVATEATTSTFTARVVDENNTQATQSLTISVYQVPAITTTSYPEAYTGEAFSGPTTATGGKAPLTWSVASGALPSGITLNSASGLLSGTPTQAGTFSFTLRVRDANGLEASQALQQIIYTPPTLSPPSVLPGAYAGEPYSATVSATGGKVPLVLSLTGGTLPSGLSFAAGAITGTAAASIPHSTRSTFTVQVMDANGRTATGPFEITTYKLPEITSLGLTTATEGVSYRRSEASPERIETQFGQGPLTYTASGLPAGLSINSSTGVLTGIPSQDAAGGYTVAFTVTDAGNKSASATLPLLVVEPRATNFGGVVGLAPSGSPITDTLTVFVLNNRIPLPGVGVRVRKNGVEYSPSKQALTNEEGKVVFTGLGLNGTTDTVDVTANGAELVNTTMAKVNSAIVTLRMIPNLVPGPRAYSSSAYDLNSSRFLLFGGNDTGASNSLFFTSCMNDMVEAVDVAQRSFSTRVPGGRTTSPSPRYEASMDIANGVAVLFGGRNCADSNTGDALGDTWEYNLSTNTWTQVNPTTRPSPRRGAALVREPSGNSLIMVGGQRPPSHSNEVWRYTPATDTWTRLGTAPFSRSWMAATANTSTGELWFCGGRGTFPGDTCHSFNPATQAWTVRPSLPSSRSDFSMAFDPFTNNLYIFGGRPVDATAPLLMLRPGGTAWEQVTPPGPNPPARYGHMMYFDRQRRELAVGLGMVLVSQFGTSQSFRRMGDVWTYNGTSWTQRGPSTPTPPGHTVSGEILNGPFPGIAEVRLVTTSGFSASTTVTLDNSGQGTYTFTGVPPGEAGLITVVGRNTNLDYPNDAWTYAEAELPPLTANRTVDHTLPFGPVAVLQASGQYQLPASWRGYVEISFSDPQLNAPGLPYVPNGTYDPILTGPQFDVTYFPASPPNVQRLNGYVSSPLPCEDHGIYNVILPGNQNIAIGGNVTALTPGQPECIPAGPRGVGTARARIFSFAPERPTVDDLDGDTFPDMVIPSLQNAGFDLVWGSPSITFHVAETACCDVEASHSVATGDFNQDGRKDLAITEAFGTVKVKLALANEPRTFGPAAAYTVGLSASGIAAADLNQDTFLDLIVGNPQNNTVQILLGQPGGTFGIPQSIALAGSGPEAVLVTNVDGDSRPDLVVVMNEGISVTLDGNTQGPFGSSTLITAGTQPRGVVVGLLDGDNLPDLAVANEGSNNITLRFGTGGGAFTAPVHLAAGTAPAGIAMAELTGDAHVDLAVTSSGDGVVTLFQGASSRTFAVHSRVPVSGAPRGVVTADFNLDGLNDVVTNMTNNGGLAILLGQSPLPTSPGATFAFTAPAQSGFMLSLHGINGYRRYWEYYSPLQAGPVSYSLPLASTLAPSSEPVAPPSGKVELNWTPWVRKWEPGSAYPFNPRQYYLSNLGQDSDTQPGASHYLWP